MKIPIKNRLLRGVVSTIAFFAIVAAGLLLCYGTGLIFFLTGWTNPEKMSSMSPLSFIMVGFIGVTVIVLAILFLIFLGGGTFAGIKKLYNGVFDP